MKSIIGLIFFLSLLSCRENPVFIDIDNILIDVIKDSTMIVNMDYLIYNPNSVKTNLEQSNLEIFYKDRIVGKGRLVNQTQLLPRDTISIPVTFEMGLQQLSEFYPYLLQSDSTAFEIKGTSKIGFLFNSLSLDISETIFLNTKKIIQDEINKNLANDGNFKITGLSMNALPSLTESNFKVNIETINNLPFDYEITEMEINFYHPRSDIPVANWQLENPLIQKSKQNTTIPIKVSLDNLSVLRHANISWITKDEIEFEVKGTANIVISGYQFHVPINDEIKLKINFLTGIFK